MIQKCGFSEIKTTYAEDTFDLALLTLLQTRHALSQMTIASRQAVEELQTKNAAPIKTMMLRTRGAELINQLHQVEDLWDRMQDLLHEWEEELPDEGLEVPFFNDDGTKDENGLPQGGTMSLLQFGGEDGMSFTRVQAPETILEVSNDQL